MTHILTTWCVSVLDKHLRVTQIFTRFSSNSGLQHGRLVTIIEVFFAFFCLFTVVVTLQTGIHSHLRIVPVTNLASDDH